MSWILKRATKLFLKDTKDAHSMSLSIIHGEVKFRGVALDEQVIQYFMGLPGNFAVRNMQCGSLYIKIPWRHMKHESVVVKIEHLIGEITEVDTPRDTTKVPQKIKKWIEGKKSKTEVDKKKEEEKEKKKRRKSKSLSGKGESLDESLDEMNATKKKKMLENMLEAAIDGLRVEIVGIMLQMSFVGGIVAPTTISSVDELGKAVRKPLPFVSFSIKKITVDTVNASQQQVDIQRAYKESTAADGTFTMRKLVTLTEIELSLGSDTVLSISPGISVLVSGKRRPQEFIASEFMFDVNIPSINISFPGMSWTSLMGIVCDTQWSVMVAKTLKDVSTAQSRLDALKNGFDIGDGVPTSPAETPSITSEGDTTESLEGTAEDVEGNDAFTKSGDFHLDDNKIIDDLDIETISRELGVDILASESAPTTPVSSTPAPEQKRNGKQMPLIHFNARIVKICAFLPGVIGCALNDIRVSSCLEKMIKNDKSVISRLSSFSLFSIAVNVNPGDKFDEKSPTSFRLSGGDQDFPYFIEGSMKDDKIVENDVPAGTEVSLKISHFSTVPRLSDMRKLVSFFTQKDWVNPPRQQPQQQQQPDQQKQDKWIEKLSGRITTGKILVGIELESGVQICLNLKSIDISASPSDLTPRSVYNPVRKQDDREGQCEMDLTVVNTLASSSSEETEIDHPFQNWKITINDLWVGMEVKECDEIWYITEPFSLSGDFVVFDPVGVVLAIKKAATTHQLWKIRQEQLPAICGRITLRPITIVLRQSVFTSVNHLFEYLMEQLETILREFDKSIETKRYADATESMKEEQMPLKKRILSIKQAVTKNMMGTLGVRFMADFTVEKLVLALATSNSSVKVTLNRMDDLSLNKKHIGLELLSQVIRDVLLLSKDIEDPLPERIFIRATLRNISGSIDVVPPPPLSVSGMVSHKVKGSVSYIPTTPTSPSFSSPPLVPVSTSPISRSSSSASCVQTIGRSLSILSTAMDKEEEEDFFDKEVFPKFQEENPIVILSMICSDYFIRADFSPAVLSFVALRPREDSNCKSEEDNGAIKTHGSSVPSMIQQSDLIGKSELRFCLRHWKRGLVFLEKISLTATGIRACMKGTFPTQIIRIIEAKNQEILLDKRKFVRAMTDIRRSERQDQSSPDALTLERRFYPTRYIAFDVEVADVFFQHTIPFSEPRNFTRIHVVPLSGYTLTQLRNRIEEYLRAIDRENSEALNASFTKNAELEQSVQEAVSTVAELKVKNAMLQCTVEEQNHELSTLKKTNAALQRKNEELQAMLARTDALLQSQCPDLPIADFRTQIQQLQERLNQEISTNQRLSVELELARSSSKSSRNGK